MEGFVPEVRFSKRTPLALFADCEACGLYRSCSSPKMPVAGPGERKILVVGEAPSPGDDASGEPFSDDAGTFLADVLGGLGVDLRRDCWLTYALRCRPEGRPARKQVEHCGPYLHQAVRQLQPVTIIPLGAAAIRGLLGRLWGSDPGGPERWAGFAVPSQSLNAWVCPAEHPSKVLRRGEGKDRVARALFRDHLARAVRFTEKPWPDGPPDYASRITVLMDPEEAAARVRGNLDRKCLAAWDLETDRLKPYAEDSGVVCCSIAWDGGPVLAYPWHGSAIAATLEFLRQDSPKVGQNVSFEHRWILRKYGFEPRGWVHDCMLAAHALDNRGGVTGLKFQAFATLGVGRYDARVSEALRPAGGGGGNAANRVHELDPKDVLLYCGMDSLLELTLAKLQMRTLGKYST